MSRFTGEGGRKMSIVQSVQSAIHLPQINGMESREFNNTFNKSREFNKSSDGLVLPSTTPSNKRIALDKRRDS